MKKIRGYLANQFGFSETGRYVLDHLIKPRIEKIGIEVLDPFIECGKEFDYGVLEGMDSHEEVLKYWKEFSTKVTPINNHLMKQSDCLLAILDGGPAIDDGVASEIGYYAGIGRRPIFALRSDFRCGENLAVSINAQVLGYIHMSGGFLAEGPKAVEDWFSGIKKWYRSLRMK